MTFSDPASGVTELQFCHIGSKWVLRLSKIQGDRIRFDLLNLGWWQGHVVEEHVGWEILFQLYLENHICHTSLVLPLPSLPTSRDSLELTFSSLNITFSSANISAYMDSSVTPPQWVYHFYYHFMNEECKTRSLYCLSKATKLVGASGKTWT